MAMIEKKGWSPYLAGALSGLLLVLSVWMTGKYFGASTTFVRAAGMVEQTVAAERVSALEYFRKEVPKVDWQFMFVIGVFVGALLASVASKDFKLQPVPDSWKERFGSSVEKRAIIAMLGGALAMFGARMAGGCPSGHGLSGASQLALSSLVSLVCFFVGGLIVARVLYGGK
jgi:uncharacterized membrane protein YedE/YeeE